MNLRCVFHLPTTNPEITERTPARAKMPSLLDIDVEYVDEPRPRGASIETWMRARGWSTED